MADQALLTKIRQWDNQIARWMMRHFYFIFFQVILVIIFVVWFANSLQIFFQIDDLHQPSPPALLTERILNTQTVNQALIVILLLFNSFWMLYIFNILQRLTGLLKDINFSLLRGRGGDKSRANS